MGLGVFTKENLFNLNNLHTFITKRSADFNEKSIAKPVDPDMKHGYHGLLLWLQRLWPCWECLGWGDMIPSWPCVASWLNEGGTSLPSEDSKRRVWLSFYPDVYKCCGGLKLLLYSCAAGFLPACFAAEMSQRLTLAHLEMICISALPSEKGRSSLCLYIDLQIKTLWYSM